jgi:tRNA (guanine-N7-)-methyltransferase
MQPNQLSAGPRGSVPAASLLFRPQSFFELLPLAALFPMAQPLEVELGSGDGNFLIEYARSHPEHSFLGVERLLGRIRKIDRKGRRAGLTNLRLLRIEAGYFMAYLLPDQCTCCLHVYFPDPWPKRKHLKNRLINEQFPGLAQRVLLPGGRIYLRTDSTDYLDQMKTVFAASPAFQEIEFPAELAGRLTDFEREFLAKGIVTQRLAFELRRE